MNPHPNSQHSSQADVKTASAATPKKQRGWHKSYTRKWSLSLEGKIGVLLKAMGITLLAFLLSRWLVSPFTATTATFFSSPEQSDFRFSDIFAQVADGRPVRQLDDRIVVVDIGNSNRHEIAETLMAVSLCEPKVVGLDVLFAEPGDDDSFLAEAISSNPGIVLPVEVEHDIDKKGNASGFHISDACNLSVPLQGNSIREAAINLPSSSSTGKSRIREYATIYRLDNGQTIESFPLALAKAYDPGAASRLLKRGADKGITAYHSREFNIIPSKEVIDRADELTGKIVVIGALNDAYDMHSTPVNSYMPGSLIHAHALATILDGTWFETIPPYMDRILAILVCFSIVMICINIKSLIRAVIIRFLQVALLYLAVRVGYTLFVDKYIICNFSYTLLMITFGLFSVDIWNGTNTIIRLATKNIKHFTSRKKTTQCEELT